MTSVQQNKQAFIEKYAPALVAASSAFVAVTAGNPAFMQSLKLFFFG